MTASLRQSVPPISQRQTDTVRRRELAAFLRSRRERITPQQVGFPPGGRRRTPGLRREEVAQLAGIGVTWYTWLEQGRDIHASEQVLDAIVRTLRLDPHERAHLFTLAGLAEPVVEQECRAIPAQIHLMLRQLEPFPAVVKNARRDILAFNQPYNALMDGIDKLPFAERNSLLLCFTRPDWRCRLLDWDEGGARAVAEFRAAMAEHVAEPSWKCLLKRLRAESPEFEALWSQHEVQAPGNSTKRFLHPGLGILCFDYTHLWLGQRSERQLTTYTPADEETAVKLPLLTSL